MAEFLVKPSGPASIRLVVPSGKGRASATIAVRPHGSAGRVSVPDALVDCIDPRDAKHLVRLTPAAPEHDADEHNTLPATPEALRKG